MNYPTPLGNRVLIRKVEPKRQTEGGLYLPDVAVQHINQGRVLAQGERVPLDLSDAEVIYPPFATLPVHWAGEELLILDYDDIMMVIE